MKRMVLIPEERLLRYEERDKQRPENEMMYGGGKEEEPQEDSLSVEMIVRGIPKTMKTRAEALVVMYWHPTALSTRRVLARDCRVEIFL